MHGLGRRLLLLALLANPCFPLSTAITQAKVWGAALVYSLDYLLDARAADCVAKQVNSKWRGRLPGGGGSLIGNGAKIPVF